MATICIVEPLVVPIGTTRNVGPCESVKHEAPPKTSSAQFLGRRICQTYPSIKTATTKETTYAYYSQVVTSKDSNKLQIVPQRSEKVEIM